MIKIPNWCRNVLVVRGPDKELDKFVTQASSGQKVKLDFGNFIEYPRIFKLLDDLGGQYTGKEIMKSAAFKEEMKKLGDEKVRKLTLGGGKSYTYVNRTIKSEILKELKKRKDSKMGFSGLGYNCGGYEWTIASWGTKWNASDISRSHATGETVYEFNTPWGPPTPVVEEMARQYKTLEFEMKSVGEGFEFIAELVIKGGKGLVKRCGEPTLDEIIEEEGSFDVMVEEEHFYPEHIAQMLRSAGKTAADYTKRKAVIKTLDDAERQLCVEDVKKLCQKEKTTKFCDMALRYCKGDKKKAKRITEEFLYGEKGVV